MELVILGIAVTFLIAAYNFGRSALFHLRAINERLLSIQQYNANIHEKLIELSAQAEALSGRKSRDLIGDSLKKSIERTNGVSL